MPQNAQQFDGTFVLTGSVKLMHNLCLVSRNRLDVSGHSGLIPRISDASITAAVDRSRLFAPLPLLSFPQQVKQV